LAEKPPRLNDAPGLAAQVFDCPSGEAFIAHLRQVYYDKQLYRPASGMTALDMAFHDGQRNLVAYIIAAVAQGKSGIKPPKSTNTEEDENA
jgi:hypothetical protein